MATFDPTKPINDPTVWFPKGMFIDNKAQKLSIKVYAVDSASEDDDKTFILNRDKMVALGRFLWTGKLLPTDRDTYIKALGIATSSVMSDKVWAEVDSLLKSYSEVYQKSPEQANLANRTVLSYKISKDCTQFKDVTWDKLVDLSGQIKTYATIAGGTANSSYYQAMLEWVGQYNDEKDKPKPDQKVLKELASGIKGAIEDEQKKIKGIEDHITETLVALKTFHDNCKRYQATLQGDEQTLKSLLEEEGSDIEHLTQVIEEELKEIAGYQTEIDEDHQKIKETAYYVWIPFIGTIAGVTVAILANADLSRAKAAMEKIQALLDENQAKLQTAYRLQADISSMATQVTDLLKVIGPAIETLEALQGAWSQMNADLQTLYELFEDDKQSIPPMLLEKRQLQTIVEAWNDLKAYADDYIQHAFMTTDPEKVTIQDYIEQLDNSSK